MKRYGNIRIDSCTWRTFGVAGYPSLDAEEVSALGLHASAEGMQISVLLPADMAQDYASAAEKVEARSNPKAKASYQVRDREEARERHLMAVEPGKGQTLKGSLSPRVTMPYADNQPTDWAGIGDARYALAGNIRHAAGKHRSPRVDRLVGGRGMTEKEAEEARILRDIASGIRRGYHVVAVRDTKGNLHFAAKRKRRR